MSAVTTDELTGRFEPVFAAIAEGALDREADRRLPHAEVEQLREAGFTKLRVPQEYGGLGATLPQFFRLLVGLGRADSNLPQLLRGHFGFVESRLVHPDARSRERWLRRVADGVIVGNAQSELDSRSFRENATTLVPDGGPWRLTGRKFYSTGSLFADWIHTTATVPAAGGTADVLVPTSSAGVHRLDDWDGFGQRLTASGTTLFESVEVHPEDVELHGDRPRPSTLAAFFQLVHLATLAGIGHAALADAAAFVLQRRRNLLNPAQPSPRHDPLVQQVVGRLAGAAFAAEAVTLAAVDALAEAHEAGLGADAVDKADAAVYAAQGQVIGTVLELVTDLFEVGGASAVTDRFRLDRHWRNARTLASHNPVVYRDRIVGDFVLNGTRPADAYLPAGTQHGPDAP